MRRSIAVLVGVALLLSCGIASATDRYERDRSAAPPSEPERRAASPRADRDRPFGYQPYLAARLGLFEGNTQFNGLKDYNTGTSFEIDFGSRVSPVLAVEGALGMYGAQVTGDEVSVKPLTAGIRLIAPNPYVEPYLGAGLGLYLCSVNDSIVGVNENASVLGGYLSLGMDAWINPKVAFNIEGKYHLVKPSFRGADGTSVPLDLSGVAMTFGLRISL